VVFDYVNNGGVNSEKLKWSFATANPHCRVNRPELGPIPATTPIAQQEIFFMSQTPTSPGNSASSRDIAYVMHPYTNLERHKTVGPQVMAKGKGIWVYDEEGKGYIEAMAARMRGGAHAVVEHAGRRNLAQIDRPLRQMPFLERQALPVKGGAERRNPFFVFMQHVDGRHGDVLKMINNTFLMLLYLFTNNMM